MVQNEINSFNKYMKDYLGILLISFIFGVITIAVKYIPYKLYKRKPFIQNKLDEQIQFSFKWSFGHFVMYFLIGLLFPNHFIFIIILSILWELYEFQSPYIIGSWTDIVTNTLGYLVGSSLSGLLVTNISAAAIPMVTTTSIVDMVV